MRTLRNVLILGNLFYSHFQGNISPVKKYFATFDRVVLYSKLLTNILQN
jgi:hypothetical protein